MKNLKPVLFSIVLILSLLIFVNNGFSQVNPSSSSNFRLFIENIAMTNDNTLEFDLYLLNTEPATPFELALLQVGVLVNPEIYNGGTLKASIVEGSSQLIEAQQPLNILFAQDANIIKLPSRTLKPLAKDAPAGHRGTIISDKAPGTHICKIRLVNSVAFSKAPANLTFNLAKTPYPTSVSQYLSGVNTPLPCNTTNCIVKH